MHRERKWRKKNSNEQRTKLRNRNKRKKQRNGGDGMGQKEHNMETSARQSVSPCGNSLKSALIITDLGKSRGT